MLISDKVWYDFDIKEDFLVVYRYLDSYTLFAVFTKYDNLVSVYNACWYDYIITNNSGSDKVSRRCIWIKTAAEGGWEWLYLPPSQLDNLTEIKTLYAKNVLYVLELNFTCGLFCYNCYRYISTKIFSIKP